jgi:hypothetical protein
MLLEASTEPSLVLENLFALFDARNLTVLQYNQFKEMISLFDLEETCGNSVTQSTVDFCRKLLEYCEVLSDGQFVNL